MSIHRQTRFTFDPIPPSFLNTFEGALEDIDETLTTNISTCFQTTGTGENTTYKPINCQGKIAQSLLNKKVHDYLIQIHCPLQDISSLIPSNVDIGMQKSFFLGNSIHM